MDFQRYTCGSSIPGTGTDYSPLRLALDDSICATKHPTTQILYVVFGFIKISRCLRWYDIIAWYIIPSLPSPPGADGTDDTAVPVVPVPSKRFMSHAPTALAEPKELGAHYLVASEREVLRLLSSVECREVVVQRVLCHSRRSFVLFCFVLVRFRLGLVWFGLVWFGLVCCSRYSSVGCAPHAHAFVTPTACLLYTSPSPRD